MYRPLANLLYRRRDPSRYWQADGAKLVVDIARCSVCQVAVGGFIEGLSPLGPSEDAQRAAKGYLDWYSKGVSCIVEEGRVGDFTINIHPTRHTAAFPGQFHHNGQPVALTGATTMDQVRELFGVPFAESGDLWDPILFYEFATGEAQFYFDASRETLESIELWYEPELSQANACKAYGIDKEFPAEFKRAIFPLDR